jgi:hypothetical protein
MHPYFSTPVQPWQVFNPIDIGMAQRPFPWFDPAAYHAMYRGAFPGIETNPYYAGILPDPSSTCLRCPFRPRWHTECPH